MLADEYMIMKKILFFILIFTTKSLLSQLNSQIDTTNYYKYYSPKKLKGKRLTTDFLRLDDVVPVMLEELKNAGHDYLYDRTIFRLPNNQIINISAYSRKSNIGFLYVEGHGIWPSNEDRQILFQKDNSHVQYVECEETFSGKANFVKIENIPSNIFVLKDDCYFFQDTDDIKDNKLLVTKETALNILRQDIRKYLSMARKH